MFKMFANNNNKKATVFFSVPVEILNINNL